jgi:hypothetical protein
MKARKSGVNPPPMAMGCLTLLLFMPLCILSIPVSALRNALSWLMNA